MYSIEVYCTFRRYKTVLLESGPVGGKAGRVCLYLLNYLFFMRAPIGVDCTSCLLLCLWNTIAHVKVHSPAHLSSQQHFLLTSQSAESQTRSQLYLWNVTFVSYLPYLVRLDRILTGLTCQKKYHPSKSQRTNTVGASKAKTLLL